MRKVYMIGNTHFDPVWLWRWDEAMSSITATFRSALDRMKEYPEFRYSFATPPVFEWIKKTSPDMFEEIKQRVKEGRWELAEGWWVQPDCYSASGESYVRQGLLGQRYLMENFGTYADVVFNIDSFGHSPMLPQILKGSGIKYYVMCRPERRHIELEEPLFKWKSPDGSCVMTYRDDEPYKTDTGAAVDEARSCPYDTMQVYGVTDHGGAPTIKSIQEIMKRDNAVFSTVKEFFENRDTDYVTDKELVTGDFGPYSNHSGIKAANRAAEYAVLNAEKTSVMTGDYDKEALKKCWQDILFNQFHDILGGACIKDAYIDAMNMYGRATATANEIMHYNLLKITNKINMPGKNPDNIWNIVVWNLNSSVYDGYIEAEVQWAHEFPWYDKGIALEDCDGNAFECQVIREKSVIPGFRSRFLFKAEIPPMGYRAFRLVRTEEELPVISVEQIQKIETDDYVIELSPESAQLTSVYDKKSKKKLCGRLLCPRCCIDDGDTWTFNTDGYGQECEPFALERVEVTENGTLRMVVRMTYSFRDSKLEMYYSIYKKEAYIDVRYRVNWNEKHLAFKLVSALEVSEHRASVPYGSVTRGETATDVPVGEWLETDKLIFVSDRIFAYNLVGDELGFTVLRSPIYGDYRLGEIDLSEDYDIMEQGITEGKVRVFFSKNKPAEICGAELNNPPVVLCEANHGGDKPSVGSWCMTEAESVAVTVVKKSETGDNIIIRGYEYSGKAQSVGITLAGKEYKAELSPYEIFTLMCDGDKAVKVNMLEE